MPTIDVNGQTLYYEVHGYGEPLLCVMGLSADTLAWTLQVPAFSAGHRTVIFDNRDVGQSLGGAIAQEVALAAPQRVRTLTLAVTFAAGGAWARKLSEVWAERVRKLSREERVDELMLLNFSERFFEDEGAVSWMRGMMLANPHPQAAEAFIRQLDASGRHDARERLRSLDLPTHVIGCEFDLLVPVWKSRELAELIPGARLTVLPAAPHGSNVERAEEFNKAVLDFIAERAPAPA
jgi:3-oxoadipate enol-lactonase